MITNKIHVVLCGFFVAFITFIGLGAFAAELKIMPLGDSITEGGYNSPANVYHSQDGGYRLPLVLQVLKVRPDTLFVGSLENGPNFMPQRHHEGHSGWRIEQISAQIDGWLKTYQPDVILLMLGTNNMWTEATRTPAVSYYETLLNQIAGDLPQTRVYAASIINTNNTTTNFEIADFNLKIEALVKKQGRNFIWVDMNKQTNFKATDLTDGVHPNASAYTKIGDIWLAALKKAGQF